MTPHGMCLMTHPHGAAHPLPPTPWGRFLCLIEGGAVSLRLERLKRRADFLRVAGARCSAARGGLVLQARVRDAAEGGMRVGFTASRKTGNAVARNRARRRLRAVAELMLPYRAAPGHDYVLIARRGTGKRPFGRLLTDLESALGTLGLAAPSGRATTAK